MFIQITSPILSIRYVDIFEFHFFKNRVMKEQQKELIKYLQILHFIKPLSTAYLFTYL